jgi:hypothetical protein
VSTDCPFPVANRYRPGPNLKNPKRQSPARIPAISRSLWTGIAVVALTFPPNSFGLSDTPPAPASPPHAMTVDDVGGGPPNGQKLRLRVFG